MWLHCTQLHTSFCLPNHPPPHPALPDFTYAAEAGFLEALLQSEHRTLDPEEAGEAGSCKGLRGRPRPRPLTSNHALCIPPLPPLRPLSRLFLCPSVPFLHGVPRPPHRRLASRPLVCWCGCYVYGWTRGGGQAAGRATCPPQCAAAAPWNDRPGCCDPANRTQVRHAPAAPALCGQHAAGGVPLAAKPSSVLGPARRARPRLVRWRWRWLGGAGQGRAGQCDAGAGSSARPAPVSFHTLPHGTTPRPGIDPIPPGWSRMTRPPAMCPKPCAPPSSCRTGAARTRHTSPAQGGCGRAGGGVGWLGGGEQGGPAAELGRL